MAVAIAICSILVAACGNSQVNPSTPVRTPTASVSAGPAASGSPTPAPSRDPGQIAVTRFFTLVTGAGFSYQASFSGDSRHTVNIVPIRNGLLQVSGKNVLVRAKFTINGRSDIVEHRLVGGRAWLKYGPLAWARWTNFQAADSMAAFAAVHAPPDVTYLGQTKVRGKALYRVTLASAIVHPVMIPAGNLTEELVTDSKLELLIDASGRPVSGTTTITGRGRVSGQLQEIIIELKITFTKVGQKVTIAAP